MAEQHQPSPADQPEHSHDHDSGRHVLAGQAGLVEPLPVGLDRLCQDHILEEALATCADPLHLAHVFPLGAKTSLSYPTVVISGSEHESAPSRRMGPHERLDGMGGTSDDEASQRFLAALKVGDLCSGTVAEVFRGASVFLDGFAARPLGFVGPLDLSWKQNPAAAVEAGQRITAEVTSIDLTQGRAGLSMAATENPELWAFLKSLRFGGTLSGTVASIEPFGVFVALDDGPDHPVFAGVGFIGIPELSWRPFEAASDVVQVGQRVSCQFLQFDTWNGEARLSLRATQPDPFQTFADGTTVGQTLQGQVTMLVPFGAFVRVSKDIEGLVHLQELTWTAVEAPEEVVQVGDKIMVVITEINRERRRLTLSRRRASTALL
ncbi:S1 RNA-binding domain-containing protein [Streptomyces sp. NPDC101151]|uniref:S1 RNA-binding domain-containing protein n=1 Tax=Streptomyces sp. NPDC101151 TaxID=3366115 RepID=UPI00381FC66E